jgi:hypothetical protein
MAHMSFERRRIGSALIGLRQRLVQNGPVGELGVLSDVPSSNFAEATRRIDTDKLNSRVLIVFNYFFPQFLSNPNATPWEGAEFVFMVSPKQGTHFLGGMARASRFAGEALSV